MPIPIYGLIIYFISIVARLYVIGNYYFICVNILIVV